MFIIVAMWLCCVVVVMVLCCVIVVMWLCLLFWSCGCVIVVMVLCLQEESSRSGPDSRGTGRGTKGEWRCFTDYFSLQTKDLCDE